MDTIDKLEKMQSNKLINIRAKNQSKKEVINSKPINLYNHGCPVKRWNIDFEKVERNNFQVFTTGDPFSVISKDLEISGANVNIHVGTEHADYLPLTLLHEALQLCRCVSEHGARSITIALPEQYQPSTQGDVFNELLLKLFETSGANTMYYYDKQYTGKLEDTDLMVSANPVDKVIPHVLLSCSANKPLAYKIATSLRMRGEMVKFYSITGAGDKAQIPEEAALDGAVVTIVQSTRPNPDCLESALAYQKSGASAYFFETVTVAKQANIRGAAKINLINPYQFSARSDKAEDNTKGKTGAYVQQNGMLFKAAGINQVVTAECHDSHTMSGAYTGKKIKGSAVSAISIIVTRLAQAWISDTDTPLQGQIRLVTPDVGAAKRTKELTEQLQAILGNKLCQSRVLGEKQRDSHKDDSALISSLNSGSIGINPLDNYLITDDETATGTTLCQAVESLSKNGAKNISVVVVHNNMPIDWLQRQLCLARFFYLGVKDLHFSDTQEMGTLAKSYSDLVATYSMRSNTPQNEVEASVKAWFKKNLSDSFTDKSEDYVTQEFTRFISNFSVLDTKTRIHSLAHEFANKVATKPYMVNPHAFEYKVQEFISKIQSNSVQSILALAGASLPAAAAVAYKLGLPLHVIPQTTTTISLPEGNFALIGVACELTRKTLEQELGTIQTLGNDLSIVTRSSEKRLERVSTHLSDSLTTLQNLYNKIKSESKLKEQPIKLLGIGTEGQVLAGQLAHLLNQKDSLIGVVAVDNYAHLHTNSVVYTAAVGEEKLCVDRNSLDMGDVCIAVGSDFTKESKMAIINLVNIARVYCYCYLSVSKQNQCEVSMDDCDKTYPHGFYNTKGGQLLFAQKVQQREADEQDLLCKI